MIPIELRAFLPELVLIAGLVAVFVISLAKQPGSLPLQVTRITALATALACLLTWNQHAVLFGGTYAIDTFGRLLQLAISLGIYLVATISARLPDIRTEVRAEYYLFMMFHALGLMLLVCSVDLIAIVVALECASFPLYIMVAMRREREGQRVQMESAIKYMMFGIAATGVMLFGMSYLYGLSGTTRLPEMMLALAGHTHVPLVIVGLGMTFAGMLYKLAVFPFHFWTPDVYQGASNETAALIATLPKIGAIVLLVRFTGFFVPDGGQPAMAIILAVFAAASLIYGNLTALNQIDLKRLLGFSAIAHAGFVMLGFVAMTPTGFSAAVFTILVYTLMVLAAFVVICRVSPDGVNLAVSDLAGLHQRSPLLALTLAAGIFGLAGIPPLAGFIGKLALLTAAIQQGHLLLSVIAVLGAAVAVYYYLRVIREAYFREAPKSAPPIHLDGSTRVLCVILIIAIVGLGVFPELLFARIDTGTFYLNLVP